MRIFATIFAGLAGLAFGSFLNVCLSRWPADESIVAPRSHCRHCEHVLAWWENVPLLSWIALGGRCRRCKARIGLRYPLVELAVGALWAFKTWQAAPQLLFAESPMLVVLVFVHAALQMALLWMLVALAALDAAEFWLPNFLTLPGLALGLADAALEAFWGAQLHAGASANSPVLLFAGRLAAAVFAAGFILAIRWLYWLMRHREGMGLGDVKLIAMLGAWLGLSGALLTLVLACMAGVVAALGMLAVPAVRRGEEHWGAQKLPFGTFLSIGGIVSSLWGTPIIAAYLRLAGF